eukprot:9467156-Pyramimonas_sp.AAC.1
MQAFCCGHIFVRASTGVAARSRIQTRQHMKSDVLHTVRCSTLSEMYQSRDQQRDSKVQRKCSGM